MSLTRRDTIQLAGFASLATMLPTVVRAQAQENVYAGATGPIEIHPVQHASFVMKAAGLTIYVDPDGPVAQYASYGAPDLVLITHEHGDHFKPETLAGIVGASTKLVVNPAVMAKLSDELKAKATQVANGEKTTAGSIEIEAVPAYNTTPERLNFHPKGRDNGYVLTADGKRIYIAGDTEDIPEMRALKDIDIAFVPMNLPFTMTVDQAADAVAAFKPKVVYPYHYRGKEGMSDIDAFATKVGSASQVVKGKWYP